MFRGARELLDDRVPAPGCIDLVHVVAPVVVVDRLLRADVERILATSSPPESGRRPEAGMRHSMGSMLTAFALAATALAQNQGGGGGDPCVPHMGNGGAAPGKEPSSPSSPATPGASDTTPSSPTPSTPSGPSAPAGSGGGPLTPGGPVPTGPIGPPPTDFPLTPVTPGAEDLFAALGWRAWWRYNGESYLGLKPRTAEIDRRITPGGEFDLGSGERRQTPWVSAHQVTETVVPALWEAIKDSQDGAQTRAAVLALGRVESSWRAPAGRRLLDIAPVLLISPDHDLVEATLVGLGLTGSREAADDLAEVLADSADGRQLCKTPQVDARLRAFAAHALGLAAAANGDDALAKRVAVVLTAHLRSNTTAPYDLQLACLTSLGLAQLDACTSHSAADAHVCRDTLIAFLIDYVDDSKRTTNLRGHAAIALARVAAVAADAQAEKVRDLLADQVGPHSKAAPQIQQCCTIALGLLGDSDEDELDDDIRDALLRIASKGDRLSRGLALISLAKIGARQGSGQNRGRAREEIQEQILAQLDRGHDERRAWAALALGVYGHEMAAAKRKLPDDIAFALRTALSGARSADDATAQCIALALLRDGGSSESLILRFEKSREDSLRACAALSLGWVGARNAVDPLSKIFFAGPRQSEVFPSAATALRLLGNSSVVPGMVEMIHVAAARKDVAGATTCAALLGKLGDPRAIDALARHTRDRSQKPRVRAACASALAELCDTHSHHWSAKVSTDSHFGLLSSTLVSFSGNGTGLLEMR